MDGVEKYGEGVGTNRLWMNFSAWENSRTRAACLFLKNETINE